MFVPQGVFFGEYFLNKFTQNITMKSPFKKIFNSKHLEFTPSIGNLIFYNESDIFPNEILIEKEKKLASILKEEGKYK